MIRVAIAILLIGAALHAFAPADFIDAEGFLHEPFAMRVLGTYSVVLSVVLLVVAGLPEAWRRLR